MSDTASLAKLQLLHPKLRAVAIQAYNEAVQQTPAGVHPSIVQTYRTFAESDHDYQLGRTIVNPDGYSPSKPMGNIISDAQAGHSWHNYGLALDFCLIINGKVSYAQDANWMKVIAIFESHGFNSGLYFPPPLIDADHLENKMGQTITGLLILQKSGKFIPGTTYVNF